MLYYYELKGKAVREKARKQEETITQSHPEKTDLNG
jgi:hypothetical protein